MRENIKPTRILNRKSNHTSENTWQSDVYQSVLLERNIIIIIHAIVMIIAIVFYYCYFFFYIRIYHIYLYKNEVKNVTY